MFDFLLGLKSQMVKSIVLSVSAGKFKSTLLTVLPVTKHDEHVRLFNKQRAVNCHKVKHSISIRNQFFCSCE